MWLFYYMLLYGTTISIIYKIKNDQDFGGNLLFSILLVGLISYSILILLSY